jgi:hypothetical protein
MRHTRTPSWGRLVSLLLLVVGTCVVLVELGIPNAAFLIAGAALVGTGTVVARRVRPEAPAKRGGSGWRMDSMGEYRWWDGSKWTVSPSGETPRTIGPEIEW